MVEEMRAKWCEDLEELLQCPVCFERPESPVKQCERGHHICNVCKDLITECPLCKSRFSNARSYLAEELSIKLDDIKLSLLHPMHSLNNRGRNSVGSQTETNVVIAKNGSKITKRAPPEAPKGKFPCRIGTCVETLPHGRMIPHIRFYHKNKFHESNCTSENMYQQVWEMEYYKNVKYDLAIRVAEMGLFFMHIKIDDNGDLFGVVQIVGTNYIGKEFNYELKIMSSKRISIFKDKVRSCVTSPMSLFENIDCLSINHKDMTRMIAGSDTFTCIMILTRLP
ncbi:E3 ubiquitin-protein ligase sina-like [Neodiprion virginianus]|uniref:E3 ubiquitin-protein ligase sina-like n=1 Tax=Neodiprion virginianus TaxID=2961670 RepID=UPI001EE6FAD9|nr:E3 ubiquitin-protein ligase sina-like [Neodiprion virginianus]